MGINTGIYKFVLVLHILSAIVGFGGVLLNGLYGAQAKARKGPEGLAIAQANFLVSKVAQYFIYAVFVFGVLLVVLSDGVWSFGDGWIWLSMVLYLIAVGISHGVLRPNVQRMIGLMEQLTAMGPPPTGGAGTPPAQLLELEERGQRVGVVAGVLDVILVVILLLMVWGPRF